MQPITVAVQQVFHIYQCRCCSSYALGGPEEIVHLSNVCVRDPAKAVVEDITTVPVLRRAVATGTPVRLTM